MAAARYPDLLEAHREPVAVRGCVVRRAELGAALAGQALIVVKPLVERVEDGEQAVAGRGGEARDLDLQPVPRPALSRVGRGTRA